MQVGDKKRGLAIGVVSFGVIVAALCAWPSNKMERLQIGGTAASKPMPTIEGTVPQFLIAPSGLAASPQAPGTPAASSQVAVYVCGAVKKSGVYLLPAGKRVVDAIAAAGGAQPDGDIEQLNLAEPLSDALKIEVPTKGKGYADARAGQESGLHRSAGRALHARSRGGRSGRHNRSLKLRPGQTLDINTATADDLRKLPGVGAGLARRIIDYRMQNGPFQTIDDLQNVAGIGGSKFARLESFLRL